MNINHFILGSKSPYRAQLLSILQIPFDVVRADVDEKGVFGNNPEEIALNRAIAKTLAVADLYGEALILGADQTLGFEGKCYGKAADRRQACDRLRQFSGNIHYLHSAYCLVATGAPGASVIVAKRVVTATMKMRHLQDQEIERYLDSGEWEGCAGCYRFEGLGSQLFDEVQGSDSAIIGLPLVELAKDLRIIGINSLLNRTPPWKISR